MNRNHYAVDFDGTLSEYHGWKGEEVYGPPVPEMMKKVRHWISHGHKVSIFTARASRYNEILAIKKWLNENSLPDLQVTNIKGSHFTHFYDDRAVGIVKNTGKTMEELSATPPSCVIPHDD